LRQWRQVRQGTDQCRRGGVRGKPGGRFRRALQAVKACLFALACLLCGLLANQGLLDCGSFGLGLGLALPRQFCSSQCHSRLDRAQGLLLFLRQLDRHHRGRGHRFARNWVRLWTGFWRRLARLGWWWRFRWWQGQGLQ
jgi:hypothetical protein